MFLFMLVTVALVIGSSVALRAVVLRGGPASARGSEMSGVDDGARGSAGGGASVPAAPVANR